MIRSASVALPPRNGVRATRLALPDGSWKLLLDFLVERFHPLPREEIRARMQRGEILDQGGRSLPPDAPFVRHDVVFYYRTVEQEEPVPFKESILYQDNHLVVADKPHFLPVTPAGNYLQETLLVRLIRRLELPDLSPVHRLDRDTAGVVLFSTDPATRSVYQELFRHRAVEKTYEAIALYDPQLELPLIRRSRLVPGSPFMRMQESVEHATEETCAETHIELIERIPDSALARYLLRPVTGKKHQLRVHMAAVGIPILNDSLYPSVQPLAAHGARSFRTPLQLLGKTVSFVDPLSGEKRVFNSKQALRLTGDTDD